MFLKKLEIKNGENVLFTHTFLESFNVIEKSYQDSFFKVINYCLGGFFYVFEFDIEYNIDTLVYLTICNNFEEDGFIITRNYYHRPDPICIVNGRVSTEDELKEDIIKYSRYTIPQGLSVDFICGHKINPQHLENPQITRAKKELLMMFLFNQPCEKFERKVQLITEIVKIDQQLSLHPAYLRNHQFVIKFLEAHVEKYKEQIARNLITSENTLEFLASVGIDETSEILRKGLIGRSNMNVIDQVFIKKTIFEIKRMAPIIERLYAKRIKFVEELNEITSYLESPEFKEQINNIVYKINKKYTDILTVMNYEWVFPVIEYRKDNLTGYYELVCEKKEIEDNYVLNTILYCFRDICRFSLKAFPYKENERIEHNLASFLSIVQTFGYLC